MNRCEELIVDNSIHQFSIEKKENNYIISRVMIAGPRDETEELILRNSG